MSGRSSSPAAISASSRCSGASSAAGAISTSSASPRLRWVKVLNQRSESISTSKRSTRTARSSVAGIDVEQSAADRELAALLDLVDALVAGRHEVVGHLVEVEQIALAQREAVRAQLGVGHLLGQRDGGHDHHRLLGAGGRVGQRVERGDSQADQMRRRRQVRLVGDAAARVVAHGARAQPRAQVLREVTRRAVVARDHDGRAPHVAIGQRGDHERPQRLRDERRAALVGQLRGRGIVLEMVEEAAERQGSSESTKAGGPGCSGAGTRRRAPRARPARRR